MLKFHGIPSECMIDFLTSLCNSKDTAEDICSYVQPLSVSGKMCVLENAHTLKCVSVIWSGWRKYLKLVFTAFYVCAVMKASFYFRHCPFQGPEGWGMNKTLFMYRQPDLFISIFISSIFWFKCVELTVTLRRFNPASRTNFMHLVGPFMRLVVRFSYFIAWWTERLQKQWVFHISPH